MLISMLNIHGLSLHFSINFILLHLKFPFYVRALVNYSFRFRKFGERLICIQIYGAIPFYPLHLLFELNLLPSLQLLLYTL